MLEGISEMLVRMFYLKMLTDRASNLLMLREVPHDGLGAASGITVLEKQNSLWSTKLSSYSVLTLRNVSSQLFS